jgi:hypothetical protein
MTLNDIRRYIHDQKCAGRPLRTITMSPETHDAVCRELGSINSQYRLYEINGTVIKKLFGLPVVVE